MVAFNEIAEPKLTLTQKNLYAILAIVYLEYKYVIEEIESVYQNEKDKKSDNIAITISTDLDNIYYINLIDEGFKCDLFDFDYVFDDLYTITSQQYDEIHVVRKKNSLSDFCFGCKLEKCERDTYL